MIPTNIKNSDFLSILNGKPLRGYRKPELKNGDRVGISKYDLLFRKGYKPQFTQDFFETVAISSRKPPTYSKKDEENKVIRGKFLERVDQSQLTREYFTIELVSNASAQLISDNTLSSFSNFSPEQLDLENHWEVAISEKSDRSMNQNVRDGKLMFFEELNSKW